MFHRSARFVVILALIRFGTLSQAGVVLPETGTNLICHYDFEHPAADPSREVNLGRASAELILVNGGGSMRSADGARVGSAHSLQTKQLHPASKNNDDWKAGVYQTDGTLLTEFSGVAGITLMGWVKPTGINPNLNSESANPDDFYNAVGLFGILSGNSDGHAVRALLEIINVSGALRLVALGRRMDTGASLTLAADEDWQVLIPSNTWTHLAATFDYDAGAMALYRNGQPLSAQYTTSHDAWNVNGGAEPDLTSSTSPAGIKIGGSYPQNTAEKNAFNGRFDDLMFFNRVLTPSEVQAQYERLLAGSGDARPELKVKWSGAQLQLSWPETTDNFVLESAADLTSRTNWTQSVEALSTNEGQIIIAVSPSGASACYFRLRQDFNSR